jgi:conjugative transfer signal peptidase TraF
MSNSSTTVLLTAAATVLMAASSGPKPAPRFMWNASESVPVGLYRMQPTERLNVTDLIVAFPPEGLATRLAEGGYLPRGVPLIKRILALPGQIVCREAFMITVDGIEMGVARERDRRGRLLPAWQGCHTLHQGEVFLMNWDEPASLDSRYFGALPVAAIFGRAVPLWTFEEH